ncbi:MAG: hypothetical protein HQM14_10020 [SAR324 cluster bacterium]|nr:hypothetical protein [SAR324 cluster bacterium]
MNKDLANRKIMVILFFLGIVFFNYPILSIFSSKDEMIFGIPLLYAAVFFAWGLLTGLVALIMRTGGKDGINTGENET